MPRRCQLLHIRTDCTKIIITDTRRAIRRFIGTRGSSGPGSRGYISMVNEINVAVEF